MPQIQNVRMAKVILVMGVTGVGKSTFIEYATGRNVEIGHGQSSCTSKVKCYEIGDTGVFLMDTPGFDDTHIPDGKILRIIMEELKEVISGPAKIHGAIYIHSVMEARMRGSGLKNLLMFTQVLGTSNMENCLLVTTKWGLQEPAVSEAREKELCDKDEFWKPLITAGADVVRFGDSMESAKQIIAPLRQRFPIEPLIIVENVTNNVPLDQTKAGRVVCNDNGEAEKRHKAEIREIIETEKEASAKKDVGFLKMLREQRKELEDKAKMLAEDTKSLALPVKKSGSGVGRWFARAAVFVAGTLATVASGGALAPVALAATALTEGVIHTTKKVTMS